MNENLQNRTLLALAPLIYVAWSDGTLTETEINRIRQRLTERGQPPMKAVLDEWLDPNHPPSAAKLLGLLETMRKAGGGERKGFKSLAEFGRFLARRGDRNNNHDADDATPGLRALQEVEAALGVVGSEALRGIFGTAAGQTGH